MTQFNIKIVSDTVCPWCYVGHRKLQRAQKLWLQENPGDSFDVTYAPYQLRPEWPRGPSGSKDKEEFYRNNFGEERTKMIHERLRAAGADVDIHFKFGGRMGNTRDSHRLVHLAQKKGKETETKVMEGLFAAYFENEKDITSFDTLKDVALSAGIAEDEFQRSIVDADHGGKEVDEAIEQVRRSGVTGVPKFYIGNAVRIDGAREPSDFLQAFQQTKSAE